MTETLEQRQAAMCRVIQHILDKKPYADLNFEEKRIAKECIDKKYIEGVELVEMISGRVVMECRFDPRLTEAGVAFLSARNSPSRSRLAEEQEKIANQKRMIEQLKKIADANDFDCIVLTREEENALRYLNEVNVLPDLLLGSEPYDRLLRLGLIEICPSDGFSPPKNASTPIIKTHFYKNAICVSDKGRDYLAYLDRRRKDERKSRRFAILTALLGAAAGAILTLLFEHSAEICAAFQRIFQSG